MTQQTALSLSEYIANEKKRLDEFEIWYRTQKEEPAIRYPLIRLQENWDEVYFQFSIGYNP